MSQLPSSQPRGSSPSPGDLSFESRFESGNLLAAARVGEEEYDLIMHPDYRCPRQTQWFYFRVQGARKDTPYTFHILNFFKRTSLYNKVRSIYIRTRIRTRIRNHIRIRI